MGTGNLAIATTVSPRARHRRDVQAGPRGLVPAAEPASGLGAIVLGAGAARMLAEWLRAHALPLLAVGETVLGLGMTLKIQLARRDGPSPRGQRAWLRLCWFGLAALGLWIAVVVAAAR